MKITERRIVTQYWYETTEYLWRTNETKKTWETGVGWVFNDDGRAVGEPWAIVQHVSVDIHGNPFIGVAEREVDISLVIH